MTQVRAIIARALREASSSGDQSRLERPAAVLWADPERLWEPVIRQLQEAVPVVVLGPLHAEKASGPAIWLRAVLAAHTPRAADEASGASSPLPDVVTLPQHLNSVGDKNPWVVYLPGVSHSDFGDLSALPEPLKPLADLQLRSVWWEQPNGRVWTPHAFLVSKLGVNVDVASDAQTKTALAAVLPELLGEEQESLRKRGRWDATDLYELTQPDPVKQLLAWMSDPSGTRTALSQGAWSGFITTTTTKYGLDPGKDTSITAAVLLGKRKGAWSAVWDRYAESVGRYPGVRAALDQARPKGTDLFGLDDPHPDSWPSWNHEEEGRLRVSLVGLAALNDPKAARKRITELEAEHRRRRHNVWSEQGEAPLALTIDHLASVAKVTASVPHLPTVADYAAWYSDGTSTPVPGHVADQTAISALQSVSTGEDRDAVLAVLAAVYDPWVDELARAFQTAATAGYLATVGVDVEPGTVVVYVDALRFDMAMTLAGKIGELPARVGYRIAAFPTVTPTGQPAVAPVTDAVRAAWGAGPAFDAGDAQGRSVKGPVLRSALVQSDVDVLDWKRGELGDPARVAWTSDNEIDSLGHNAALSVHGFVQSLDGALDRVAGRIRALAGAGWRRVVVVTDHGFLLPTTAATKVELAAAITEGDSARKPRTARLKAASTRPEFPIVPWTWDENIDMVSAPGAGSFEAGITYTHGGLSPQECITPFITIDVPDPGLGIERAFAAAITKIDWTGQRVVVDYLPADAAGRVEVRLAAGDAHSVVADRPTAASGRVRILVDEELAAAGVSAFVVLTDDSGDVVAQKNTTVGGDE